MGVYKAPTLHPLESLVPYPIINAPKEYINNLVHYLKDEANGYVLVVTKLKIVNSVNEDMLDLGKMNTKREATIRAQIKNKENYQKKKYFYQKKSHLLYKA